METRKVIEYVQALLKEGYSMEEIEKRLLDAGWTMEEIEECIDVMYESRPGPAGAQKLPGTGPAGRPRIKSNFPTLIKPRLREEVYKPLPPPEPPPEGGAGHPKKGGGHLMENKALVAGVVIAAVAGIAIVAWVVLFLEDSGNGAARVTGLEDFQVPEDRVLYAGASGNLRLTLKSVNRSVIVERIEVGVNGVTGSTSPEILISAGSQSSFIISGLPVLYEGQAFTARVDVTYRDSGMQATSTGTISGRVS